MYERFVEMIAALECYASVIVGKPRVFHHSCLEHFLTTLVEARTCCFIRKWFEILGVRLLHRTCPIALGIKHDTKVAHFVIAQRIETANEYKGKKQSKFLATDVKDPFILEKMQQK